MRAGRRGVFAGQLPLLELVEPAVVPDQSARASGDIANNTNVPNVANRAARQPRRTASRQLALDEVGAAGELEASDPVPGERGTGELGEWQCTVLLFANRHHLSGQYADRVQQQLGCSVTRYLQTLADMLDHSEALAAAPELVVRLRVLRDRRRDLRQRTRTR